jgi:CSLREA domain-containing protein
VFALGNTNTRVEVRNSIIAGNTGTDVDFGDPNDPNNPNLVNSFQSNNFNLIGDGNASGEFVEANDQRIGNGSPGLSTLGENGGPTPTRAISIGGPAFDRGDSAQATDQRGVPRPQGRADDIGAFELSDALSGAAAFVVTTLADNTNVDGEISLREAILNANDNADINTISFRTGLSGTITLTSGLPDLTRGANIVGPGAATLTVDGATLFPIFNIQGQTVTISGLTLFRGQGNSVGGAVRNQVGNVSLSACVLRANTAVLQGGAIYNEASQANATFSITNCTIEGNSTSQAIGGAIYNYGVNGGSATISISNSTLNNNTAPRGGAIANQSSTLNSQATINISNSTLSANTADQEGGAIYNDANATSRVTLSSVTLSGNSAPLGGGIRNVITGTNATATVTLGNSLLNAGASGTNLSNGTGATIISEGYNLSSDASGGNTGTTAGGLLNGTGDIRNTDPLLAALTSDPPGSTATHALRPGSPAVNAGNPAFLGHRSARPAPRQAWAPRYRRLRGTERAAQRAELRAYHQRGLLLRAEPANGHRLWLLRSRERPAHQDPDHTPAGERHLDPGQSCGRSRAKPGDRHQRARPSGLHAERQLLRQRLDRLQRGRRLWLWSDAREPQHFGQRGQRRAELFNREQHRGSGRGRRPSSTCGLRERSFAGAGRERPDAEFQHHGQHQRGALQQRTEPRA